METSRGPEGSKGEDQTQAESMDIGQLEETYKITGKSIYLSLKKTSPNLTKYISRYETFYQNDICFGWSNWHVLFEFIRAVGPQHCLDSFTRGSDTSYHH